MELKVKIIALLRKNNYKITTAESITGGKIISSLIDVPGASNVIQQAYIVYSNKAKIEVLGVAPELIENSGVVSEDVVLAMARSAKKLASADVVITTSGEAGPKPNDASIKVGTVCFALIINQDEYTYKMVFSGNRLEIIEQAQLFILNELYLHLNELK